MSVVTLSPNGTQAAPAPESVMRVLRVDSSSRYVGSVTRALGDSFVEQLSKSLDSGIQVIPRDVATGLPFIDEVWVNATFTAVDQRNAGQRAKLAQSDGLVAELQTADVILITAPVYNFGVPATLKAWIDLVARAGLTFRYTPNGPVGLLNGKRAYVILASGGTPIGGEIDFASRYLRHVLGFIGIQDVTLIAAERLNAQRPESMARVERQITAAVSDLTRSFQAA